MPLLLLIVGLILIVTGIRGTTGSLAGHLKDDISAGFIKWLAAILVIGALGFIPQFQKPSRLLLALVVIVVMLKNGSGFIDQFVRQIEAAPQPSPAQPAGGNANLPAIPLQIGQAGSSGAGGAIGAATGVAKAASGIFGLFGG